MVNCHRDTHRGAAPSDREAVYAASESWPANRRDERRIRETEVTTARWTARPTARAILGFVAMHWRGYDLKLRMAVFSSDCTSKTVNRRVICRMS